MTAGHRHTCAIRETGEIDCWGENEHGQTDAFSGSYRAVSAGQTHTCAVKDTGEMVCWGARDEERWSPGLLSNAEPRSCTWRGLPEQLGNWHTVDEVEGPS